MCRVNDTAQDSIPIRRAILALLDGKKLTGKELHKQLNNGDSYNKFAYHIEVLVTAGNIKKDGKQGNCFLYKVINPDYQPTFYEKGDVGEKLQKITVIGNKTTVTCDFAHTTGHKHKQCPWIGSSLGGLWLLELTQILRKAALLAFTLTSL